MKICYIIPDFGNGGIEALLFNYISRMDRKNFNITILSYGASDRACVGKFERLGIKIFVFSHMRKKFVNSCLQILNIMRSERFDIVHSHVNEFNCVLVGLAFLAGIKVRISHSHAANIPFSSPLKKLIYKIKCMGGMVFATDYWACGKKAGAFLFGERAVKKGKVHIMNNAVNCELFQYSTIHREAVQNELDLHGFYCIGHVARFDKQKNNEFVIDLIHQLSRINDKFKLLWIGDGKDRSKVENIIKDKRLENKIILLGTINDIYRYYQAMDIFILPSLFEGLPICAIEAQLTGLPTLLSNTITDEVKLSDLVSMLPIDNIQLWIDKIVWSMNSMNANIRESRYFEEYDIDKQIKVLERSYNEMYKKR